LNNRVKTAEAEAASYSILECKARRLSVKDQVASISALEYKRKSLKKVVHTKSARKSSILLAIRSGLDQKGGSLYLI